MSFRSYFDKDLEFLIKEEERWLRPYSAKKIAKQRLRMYAGLFTRDLRKTLINEDSKCFKCGTMLNLHLDHIIPISKGGKNELNNIQILCQKCNLLKGNKINED